MRRNEFITCMGVLREYAAWDKQLYALGIDLTESPASKMADHITAMMCDYDRDWSYDEKLGLDWIIEWTYTPDSPNFMQTRHGRTWYLEDAGILYEFIQFMNEHGWED